MVVLVPCVSVVASRIACESHAECTPNARKTRAQRSVRPWRCLTGQPNATKHSPTPHGVLGRCGGHSRQL
eukprot:2448212-Prymnesium_polylepis.1